MTDKEVIAMWAERMHVNMPYLRLRLKAAGFSDALVEETLKKLNDDQIIELLAEDILTDEQ